MAGNVESIADRVMAVLGSPAAAQRIGQMQAEAQVEVLLNARRQNEAERKRIGETLLRDLSPLLAQAERATQREQQVERELEACKLQRREAEAAVSACRFRARSEIERLEQQQKQSAPGLIEATPAELETLITSTRLSKIQRAEEAVVGVNGERLWNNVTRTYVVRILTTRQALDNRLRYLRESLATLRDVWPLKAMTEQELQDSISQIRAGIPSGDVLAAEE